MSLRRVSNLILEDFKGFSGRTELDLDADIVMLVGANGRGKTSTIEALELIATGTIAQRFGDEKDFKYNDFIHNSPSSSPRPKFEISVDWRGGGESDKVIFDRSSSSKMLPASTGQLASQHQRLSAVERELIRTCAFLYSDTLGGLAGLDADSRRQVIDFFVPSFFRLEELIENQASWLGHQISISLKEFSKISPDDLEDLRSYEAICAQAAQASVIDVAPDADISFFVKKGKQSSIKGNLIEDIKKVCVILEIESLFGGREYYQHLRKVSEAARVKAQVLDAVAVDGFQEQSVYRQAHMSQLKESLRLARQVYKRGGQTDLPGPDLLKARIAQLNHIDTLKSQKASVCAVLREMRQASEILWLDHHEDEQDENEPRIASGALSMLATLARIDPSTPLPEWWEKVGFPRPDPVQFRTLLVQERIRWANLRSHISRLESELRHVDNALDELNMLNELELHFEKIDRQWHEAGKAGPLPVKPDGTLDTDELQREFGEQREEAQVSKARPGDGWRKVAEYFASWADARKQYIEREEDLRRQHTLVEARDSLKQMESLVNYIRKDRGANFRDALRTCVAKTKYQKGLNDSLQQILRWYAHRSEISSYSRVEFNQNGPLKVLVDPENGVSRGITSLSRSQLASLALGLAVVANLGRSNLPVGFICLDDVSDVFDLDNIAADAAVLRLLAYGASDSSDNNRRQLILTNHNDEVTDRIVPLLLPPPGRSMRIIEFIDNGPDKPVQTKQWEVQADRQIKWNGRSPLRELFPEIASNLSF